MEDAQKAKDAQFESKASEAQTETSSANSNTKSTDAKKVWTMDDVKFNPENKTLALFAALIPIVGLIVLFTEKKDGFVRFYAAQSALTLVFGVLSLIPYLGCIFMIIALVVFIFTIIAAVKAYNGEVYKIPVLGDYAVSVMNAV